MVQLCLRNAGIGRKASVLKDSMKHTPCLKHTTNSCRQSTFWFK